MVSNEDSVQQMIGSPNDSRFTHSDRGFRVLSVHSIFLTNHKPLLNLNERVCIDHYENRGQPARATGESKSHARRPSNDRRKLIDYDGISVIGIH